MNAVKIAALALLAYAGVAAAQTPSAAPEKMVPAIAPNGPRTAEIPLDSEFTQIPMKGYLFTQSYNTVAPHTGRPMHSHVDFPEIVRVVSGTLTDQRKGAAPAVYGPGSTIINAGGVDHMWANLGSEPVVFIATQIRAPGK